MTVTITQVKRAAEEAANADVEMRATVRQALRTIAADGTALTLLANSINQKTGATLEVQNCLAWTDEERQADARRAKNHAVGFGDARQQHQSKDRG